MSSSPRSRSPSQSSEEDQRKRKRMLSNRESARRCRLRKQQHLDGLLAQAARLRAENERVSAQVGAAELRLAGLDGGNAALRTQVAELGDRLRSLRSALRFVEEFEGGTAVQPEEVPLPPPPRRWHLPCPAQHPIVAMHSAADAFGF